MSAPPLCVGALSGTSMDAIDVAALRTDGEGAHEPLAAASQPLDAKLRARLAAALGRRPPPAPDAAASELERDVTDAFAGAIEAFIAANALTAAQVDLVGCHGQTIYHDPAAGVSRQLCAGQRLADRLGIDVVCDFRAADLAAGGEGAPLVPIYHAALAAELARPVCFLNLGGVGNLTYVGNSPRQLRAADTGPANALLDDCIRARRGVAMDEDGALAASGKVDPELVAQFRADPYLARPFPKSLDRNHFHGWLERVAGLADADALATLAELSVAGVVAAAALLKRRPLRWLVCGGGRRNGHLMRRLGAELGAPVEPVEAVGLDGDALEAQLFAYLAARSVAGLPLSYPRTTGAAAPTCGGVLYRAGS